MDNNENEDKKREDNNASYNYGKARKETGVGCSPTLASGCLISIIVIILILFFLGIVGPWIIKVIFDLL